MLKDCATDDTSSLKHCYEAANGAELSDAFGEISCNIEKFTISRGSATPAQKEKAAAS